jgi:hypothetical protein
MKKIMALFLVLTLAATMFACGGRNNKKTTVNTNTTHSGIIPDMGNGTNDTTATSRSTTVTSRNTTSTNRTTDMSRRTETLESTQNTSGIIGTSPSGGTEATGSTRLASTGGGTTVR